MSEHIDEPLDQDLLLKFSTEPEAAPLLASAAETLQPAASEGIQPVAPAPNVAPELIEALNARVERMERTLDESASLIASLNSEVATLVGTLDDIKKRLSRREAPAPGPLPKLKPSPRIASAFAGAVIGIALGMWGWTLWSRESPVTIGAASVPVVPVAMQPLAVETPSHPEIALAAAPAPAAPVRDLPARTARSTPPAPARIDYVGTLSIDAAPGGAVFINRQPAGSTPLRVANLKAGSHLVWIERDGYRRFTRVVQVPADRVTRLFADLEPVAR